MKNLLIYFDKLKLLLFNILTLLAIYLLCRILFLIFNNNLLLSQEKNGFFYWINLFWGGFIFDICAITIINIPFMFFYLIPLKIRNNKLYKKITTILFFYIFNIIAISFNLIDIAYSSFTKKRMTFDVFNFFKIEGGFIRLIPDFFKDFWFLILIFIIITVVFIVLSEKINRTKESTNYKHFIFFLKNIPQFLICILLCFIGSRASFGLKPISIISASKYAIPSHYSIVLNTPFTIIKSAFKEQLEKKKYFSEAELKKIYNPIYFGNSLEKQQNYNVVIIILESFSMEYSAILNENLEKSDIPNFDSIAKLGQIVPVVSNSVRSMEGIAAIISGIPTLMNNDFMTSIYSGNKTTSLPMVLKKFGYNSAFFHGGKNGTLNLDNYTRNAGFDKYYGKNEYNNDNDFDGAWGIFDDKFFNYFSKQLDKMKQPFFSTIFTLSSHHPYVLPQNYKENFKISEENVLQSIKYSDWALGEFFKTAQKSEWFKNTVFFITADHSANQRDDYFKSPRGLFLIPMIVYAPNFQLPKIKKSFVQQTDILPTVLNILNINDTTFAFGKSIFNNEEPFSINFINSNYQFYSEDFVIIYNGEKINHIYNYLNDKYLQNNLYEILKSENNLPEKDINFMKAIIQSYNNALIDNKMYY